MFYDTSKIGELSEHTNPDPDFISCGSALSGHLPSQPNAFVGEVVESTENWKPVDDHLSWMDSDCLIFDEEPEKTEDILGFAWRSNPQSWENQN